MGHTCRGTINLATANIAVEDSCNFVISNGGAQTYHLKANSEVERQRWITALELAKAKAVTMQAESGERIEMLGGDRISKSIKKPRYMQQIFQEVVCLSLDLSNFFAFWSCYLFLSLR